MHPLLEDKLEPLTSQWLNWCRLCAKEDVENNINFLYQNEEQVEDENKMKMTLQEALEKYFRVQSSLEDLKPKMLCSECLSLVSNMINFNERVIRVQEMFKYLSETAQITKTDNLESIRLKFDVTEKERDQWFSKYAYNGRHGLDSKRKLLDTEETSQQSGGESKLRINIKKEHNGDLHAMEYDEYMQEDRLDTDLDQEEMLYEDSYVDKNGEGHEEDPFNTMTKEKSDKFFNYSSEEDYNDQEEDEYFENEEDNKNLNGKVSSKHLKSLETNQNNLSDPAKVDKSKKKRKRKKLKHPSNLECPKKKPTIKDFSLDSTCKECGDNFTIYSSYRKHMMEKHGHSMGDKHWQCPSCDKVLLSLYNLERHVRIHIPLEERKLLKCTECDNRYTSNAQLETHIKYKHKNEKPFICEECGLCLRTNSNLRQHMLTHTDLAPFECDVCKKRFKNKSRLKNHMDIHSPNKHICAICGLQLNSRATLNRHFLVHSDEMLHKCDYCGRAFKRAKALKNHLLLHTGLKPYSCDFCDRTFANGSNCRSHMKKMHPEELASLEASGNKTHTKNIPKLETLKAVTKGADNLTPVVTKFSGCFAFGKKTKAAALEKLKSHKTLEKRSKHLTSEKLSATSLSSPATALNLETIPLVGNTSSTCPRLALNQQQLDLSTHNNSSTIPNFENIYQHLMKQQNHADLQLKRTASQLTQISNSNDTTPQHNTFYQSTPLTPSHPSEDLLRSPESHHGSVTPLTHDDHSNASSVQAPYYGPIRSSCPPGKFM